MSSCVNKVFLQVRCRVQAQQVRYRRINIQKPWPSHFERAKVEALVKPKLPRSVLYDPNIPAYEKCKVGEKYFVKEEIDNPYERLLADKMRSWFDDSKLIAFFHRNAIPAYELFEMKLMLKKHNMTVNEIGKKLMQRIVTGTVYEPTVCLFDAPTAVVCCEEPEVAVLVKLLKMMPRYVLMAAVVEGRFLSRAEIEYYAKLPDLQTVRSGLVAVLNMAGQDVVQKLNHHQSTLVQHLNQHIELSMKDKTDNTESS